MPDSQHVLSFLGGLGSSLVGGLKEQAALREKDKSEAATEKAAQEQWLHGVLLKSLDDPSQTIEHRNATLRYLFEQIGPKAGVKPENLHEMMSHIMQQTGVVKEPVPIAQAAFEVGTGGQEPPPTERPMTVGDVQNKQLQRRYAAQYDAQIPLANTKALAKRSEIEQRLQGRIAALDETAKNKATARFNEYYQNELSGGATPEDARTAAHQKTDAWLDVEAANKKALGPKIAAQTKLIAAKTADIEKDNIRADAFLANAQQRTQLMAAGVMNQNERTRLLGVSQQLGELKARRAAAASAMRQAAAITADDMKDTAERNAQQSEWWQRKSEIDEIDKAAKELTDGLPQAGAPSRSLSKVDSKLKKYADTYFGGDVERAKAYAAAHP
jgi:hypothetical protein